ncbi:RidA family protein [Conexibacter woesei]|uniref:Endoribonuclease L-PSP n=1 Tax=Conexibacter woesei (strain DSM 14684 / CCUG 47730 / CIP 108061 / JCM 11494 / NBRC 100937 / ID131577) TaxID=469383 RepID=D3F5G2_CONWI|nr:RidA family protein [Conexibacter woesei]ADB50629.1 Endoribonuclease L-PSP [Conexibacter woesei DSM 14684]
MSAEERMRALGLELPAPFAPVGAYVAARRAGDQLHVSGQGPLLPGGGFVRGKVGAELTLEQAQEAARLAALSALATMRDALGTLDRVVAIARVVGYVNCAPGFNATPAVLDGCSKLLLDALGEAGRHARSAIGVAELPFDIAVEVDLTAVVAD